MTDVTIRKLDHMGREVLSYPGTVLEQQDDAVTLRTSWDRSPVDLGFVVLEPGDCWTEFFYSNRWYNVFEIRAGDGRLKGWYCNITRPARIGKREVAAEDLALDLWVEPDGETTVLDEGEFAQLPLSRRERRMARQALVELEHRVEKRLFPFSTDTRSGGREQRGFQGRGEAER